MTADVDFVRNYFFERHIALNEEWLQEAVAFLTSHHHHGSLASAVFEQWLFADIKLSSYPSIQFSPPAESTEKVEFPNVMALQITWIVDIGSSLLSQYKQMTYEFEDNSGFACEDEQSSMERYEAKPRRMLLMELTDGETSLRAIEYRPVNSLSILTCPGSKILVYGGVSCRRATLLLTEKNCEVLGGDVEELMKTNRPVEIMGRRLDKTKKISSTEKKESATPSQNVETETATPVHHQNVTSVQRNSVSRSAASIKRATPSEFSPDQQATSSTNSNRLSCAASKSKLSKSRPSPSRCRLSDRPVMEVRPLPDEEKPSKAALQKRFSDANMATPSTSRVMATEETPNISPVGRISSGSTGILEQSPTSSYETSAVKRIKLEPPDDHDEIMIVENVEPGTNRRSSIFSRPVVESSPSVSSSSVYHEEDRLSKLAKAEPLVARYAALGVTRIADALKSSRYSLGSKRRKVVAFMNGVKEPLRIVDEEWTMTVKLTDESYSQLECSVAHSVLYQLIGLTPSEARAIRMSEDKVKKKEGTLRIQSVKESLERLDIVWEIEFFAVGSLSPVVKDLQTLSQVLNLID